MVVLCSAGLVRGLVKNIICGNQTINRLNAILLNAVDVFKTGLLDIIPEFRPAVGMTQNRHHKEGFWGTVYGHTLDVVQHTPPILRQRLIALFHDIGKTVTRSRDESGVHFYRHEEVGANMSQDIMQRLGYPANMIRDVACGVLNHMRLKSGKFNSQGLSNRALRRFKADVGDILDDLLEVINADNICHHARSAMPDQIRHIRHRFVKLASHRKLDLAINGADLILMGLKPGPHFKQLLGLINENMDREEALATIQAYLRR